MPDFGLPGRCKPPLSGPLAQSTASLHGTVPRPAHHQISALHQPAVHPPRNTAAAHSSQTFAPSSRNPSKPPHPRAPPAPLRRYDPFPPDLELAQHSPLSHQFQLRLVSEILNSAVDTNPRPSPGDR